MPVEVRVVEQKEDYENALSVRRVVFVEEQQVPIELEIDNYEEASTHFVAYDDEHLPVGAGRLRSKGDWAKVERICVLKDRRREHIGEAIMERLEEVARKEGFKRLSLNAQTHAQKFYEKLGYQVTSELFYEAGIPHVEMRKDL